MNAIVGVRQSRDTASLPPTHLVHVFPSFAVGGVPVRIATVINRLGNRFRHTILALDGDYGACEMLDPAVEARTKGDRPARQSSLRSLRTIRRTLANERPALIATYNWGSIEWAFTNMLCGIAPHVHFESGFGVEEADRQLWRRAAFRRLALARTRRVVVPSRTLAHIATTIWKIPRRILQIIPNGVDCRMFTGEPGCVTNGEFRQAPDQLVVGTVAPLRPEKDLERLLRVFAQLPRDQDVRLVIVGDGTERGRLEQSTRELGISGRTLFTGHRADVPSVLRGFDIFVMTSATEQMPNSLLQAMATGRPVVATDVGDVKDMVAIENRAFVSAKNDEAELLNSLRMLVGDRAKRITLSRANQSRAQDEYGLDRMVEAYGTLFHTVGAAA